MKHTVSSYLEDLEARLPLLSESERKSILAEYRAHMTAEIAAGTPEHEALRKFGKPAKVAHQFYTTYGVYERFRKWQYAALGGMVLYILGLNEYAFGNPVAVLYGHVPVSHTLWSLSLVIIGPIGYWIMCNRCYGQKLLPLILAWLVFTPGFSYTTAKIPQLSFEYSHSEFAQLPKTPIEAQELASASAPLQKIAELANKNTTPADFGKKLLELQPTILKQARFFNFRTGEPKTYLVPVMTQSKASNAPGKLPHASLLFGYTDGSTTALGAWKGFSIPAENLASLIQPNTVEYSTQLKRFTMGSVLSRWTTWTSSLTYFLFIAAVGILFTYIRLPQRRRRAPRGIAG